MSRLRATFTGGNALDDTPVERDELELLKSGKAKLDADQPYPPDFLLDHVDIAVGHLPEAFGPDVSDADSLRKVSNGLVDFAGRKYSIEGKPVAWADSLEKLMTSAIDRIASSEQEAWTPWSDAKRVLRAHMRVAAKFHSRDLSLDECARRGWVKHGPANFLDGTHHYTELRVDWFAFHRRHDDLTRRFLQYAEEGLRQGRIICCEETGSGARVIPPSWFSNDAKLQNGKHHFCLTLDLPLGWFSSFGKRRANAQRAARWMNETFKAARKSGRYAKVSDLQTIAAERFNVAKSTISKEYYAIDDRVSRGGNVSHEQKLTLQEIRDKY